MRPRLERSRRWFARSLPSKDDPSPHVGSGLNTTTVTHRRQPLLGMAHYCADELDRYLALRFWWAGHQPTGDEIARMYDGAKGRGELPDPGPRGPGVNVRKPWTTCLSGALGTRTTARDRGPRAGPTQIDHREGAPLPGRSAVLSIPQVHTDSCKRGHRQIRLWPDPEVLGGS